jgi:hypothetical protein
LIDDLTLVLGRQCDAAVALEGRLCALELLVEAGEVRFVARAVDEVTAAADRLAALELTRNLTLSALGVPVDVRATAVAAAVPAERAGPFTARVDELRATVARVSVRRERVRQLAGSAHDRGCRARLGAASPSAANA